MRDKPFLMLKSVKQFFQFNKNDRNAAAFLLLILTIILVSKNLFEYISASPNNIPKQNNSQQAYQNFNLPKNEALDNEPPVQINDSVIARPIPEKKEEIHRPQPKPLKTFNPNSVTKSELMALGVNEYSAEGWVKYIQAGGRFSKPEQMKKIYGLSLHEYEQIAPYAKIDPFYQNVIEKDSTIIVDLNKGTYKDFQKIEGIGEKRAKTMVEYRNHLGGYINVEQLKEIPRFPKKNFDKIVAQLTINQTQIQKIKLNSHNFEQLVYHPYIDTAMAKKLLTYRAENGKINTESQLNEIEGFDTKKIKILKPYLSFE